MRYVDLTTVWACSKEKHKVDGETQEAFFHLRELRLNVQYLSDELERESYGEVKNSEIVLRSDTVPDLRKGDHLYLKQPEPIGTTMLQGEETPCYGPGDYMVTSVKPAYVGVARFKNPTVTTAKAVTK